MPASFERQQNRVINLGVYVGMMDERERQFLQDLSDQAGKRGIRIGVFSRRDIDFSGTTIRMQVWDHQAQRWLVRDSGFPKRIYNRCLDPARPARAALTRLLRASRAQLLQRPIAGKWRMQQLLRRHPLLRSAVPRGARLRGRAQLTAWLRRAGAHVAAGAPLSTQRASTSDSGARTGGVSGSVVLKPLTGSGGRGVLRLSMAADGAITARGRDRENRIVNRKFEQTPKRLRQAPQSAVAACLRWIRQTLGPVPLLMQPFYKLETRDGRPFDMRAFVRKQFVNKSNNKAWQTIGYAVRVGESGGLTSNLAGGGVALTLQEFMKHHYTNTNRLQTKRLIERMNAISRRIAQIAERRFGTLFELGIDFALTESGQLYVLEVNGKPGRSAFLQSQQADVYTATIHGVIHAYLNLTGGSRH